MPQANNLRVFFKDSNGVLEYLCALTSELIPVRGESISVWEHICDNENLPPFFESARCEEPLFIEHVHTEYLRNGEQISITVAPYNRKPDNIGR